MPKISELNAITSVANTDLLMVVHDPSGSPSTNKVTLTNLGSSITSTLRTANTTAAGTIRVGDGLFVANGVLSANALTILPSANTYEGYILTWDDEYNAPIWAAFSGVRDFNVINAANTYSAQKHDCVVLVDPNAASHDIKIVLPDTQSTPPAVAGKNYFVKNIDNGGGVFKVTVTTYSGETYGSNYIEHPLTGAFEIDYDITGKGSGEEWIFDGTVWRHLTTQKADALTMLTPNIAFTGVFNGYPASLPVVKNQGVFFTGNGSVLETTDKYWISGRFSNYDYDLSGLQSLDLINIGGIQGDFRMGGKSETLLTSIDLHDVAVINEDFYITDLPALETFNANNLVFVNVNFQINSMDNANTQFNFPNLNTIRTNFYYTYNDVLTNTPQFPALETVNNGFYIYYNDATQNTMTFDSLRYAGYYSVYNNDGMLAGPVFPALTTVDYFDMNSNANMIDPPLLPVLETVNNTFNFYNHASVTTAPPTPALITTGAINWYNNTSMANGFNFSSLKTVNGGVDINGCALDQQSVDYILTTLAGLDGTNGTTAYSGQTINLSGGTNSPPSANGLSAKTVLEGRTCTVSVNS